VPTGPIDAIKLEIWWSRLVAIADEAATTLLRTACAAQPSRGTRP